MRRRRTFKDFLKHMRETRAGRLAVIALVCYLSSGLLRIVFESKVKWLSMTLFIVGTLAFLFAALNTLQIEFNFMPRFLRGRVEHNKRNEDLVRGD